MDGKICIVTGANNGFGFVTARDLTAMGAQVVMICRSEKHGQAAQQKIKAATGRTADLLIADLSIQSQVKRVAAEFRAKYDRLDVLVNNAGFAWSERELTEEGFERTFALNYLAYFTLTMELSDLLIASAPARIVNIASASHRWSDVSLDNLQGEKSFPMKKFPPLPLMYGWTNMERIMLTYELAKRLEEYGVTANVLCPGFVSVSRSGDGMMGKLLSRIMNFMPSARSPEQAAETIVYLASSPEAADLTGQYYQSGELMRSADQSYDGAFRLQLWDKTLELLGYDEDPLTIALKASKLSAESSSVG